METVIRVTIVYLFILFGLRIMGKREFSQMSPMELVTLLLIPELVSQSLVREDFSLTNGIISVATLFILVFLTSVLVLKSKQVEKVVEGTPAVLVHQGQLVKENMHKERVTAGEIFNEMHKSGLDTLEEVQWAILETDGKISIVPKNHDHQGKPSKSKEKALAG